MKGGTGGRGILSSPLTGRVTTEMDGVTVMSMEEEEEEGGGKHRDNLSVSEPCVYLPSLALEAL